MEKSSLEWLYAQNRKRTLTGGQHPVSMLTATVATENTPESMVTENGRLYEENKRLRKQLVVSEQRVVELAAEKASYLGYQTQQGCKNDETRLFKKIFEHLAATASKDKHKTQREFGRFHASLHRKCEKLGNGVQGFAQVLSGTEMEQCLFRLNEKMQEYGKIDKLVEIDVEKLRILLAQLAERVQTRQDLLNEFNIEQLIKMVEDSPDENNTENKNTNIGPKIVSTYSLVVDVKATGGAVLSQKYGRLDEEEALDLTKKSRIDTPVPEITTQFEDTEVD